jgi:hypothetical protein
MRLPNLVYATGFALIVAVLSGCAPSGPAIPPEPTATFVAPYATDEEALAAAEEAYAEYVRVLLESYRRDASGPSALHTVASGGHLKELLAEFEDRVAGDRYIIGEQSFDQMVLQRYSRDSSLSEVIAVYLCDDLSGLAIYQDGEKVAPIEPLPPTVVQVVFDYSPDSKSLLVSARDIWSDEPC